jgi:hypothetical protein
MSPVVTGFAQKHEIPDGIRAEPHQRFNMMQNLNITRLTILTEPSLTPAQPGKRFYRRRVTTPLRQRASTLTEKPTQTFSPRAETPPAITLHAALLLLDEDDPNKRSCT